MDPKHGFAALLLDAHGVKPKDDKPSEDDDPAEAMAEEILKAVEDKDAGALAEALKAFCDHHEDSKDDAEDEDKEA